MKVGSVWGATLLVMLFSFFFVLLGAAYEVPNIVRQHLIATVIGCVATALFIPLHFRSWKGLDGGQGYFATAFGLCCLCASASAFVCGMAIFGPRAPQNAWDLVRGVMPLSFGIAGTMSLAQGLAQMLIASALESRESRPAVVDSPPNP